MTASPVQLDSRLFHKRLRVLCNHWRNAKKLGGDSLADVDTILIHVGIPNDSTVYQKSTALHFWLFGYEFPETILAIHLNGMSAITSPKKGAILEALNSFHDKSMDISIYKRSKDISEQETFFASLFKSIESHGSKIGILAKDKAESPLIADWNKYLEAHRVESGVEMLDITASMANVLSVKDEDELILAKLASKASAVVMEEYVMDQIMTIIDEEKKVSHESLSEKIEQSILVPQNPKKKMPVKFGADVNVDYLEMCYPPIIQSGGTYNLRPSASSNTDSLHAGTVICSLGVRYKSYCSNIGRTFMVSPSEAQEANYKFLLDLQKAVLAEMRPGTAISKIYLRGLDYVKANRPELENKLVTNFGFGIGLEFRESEFLLNAKNEKEIRHGMIMNLAIGFQDLVNEEASDPKAQKYALFLADTVLVGKHETMVLTECERLKKLEHISFVLDKSDASSSEVDEVAARKTKKGRRDTSDAYDEDDDDRPVGNSIIKTRLRSQSQKHIVDTAASKKRELHQKELLRECIRAGLSKANVDDENQAGRTQVEAKVVESYKKEAFMPEKETRELKIYVDKRAETVLLPIYGVAVPFHISVIKNVAKSEEGEFLYLRINFNLPAKSGAGVSNVQLPNELDSKLQFIKSMTFRSADIFHMTTVYKDMTELRKVVTAKETQKKEMADLVVQESLVELKPSSGKKPARLPDVYMRPAQEGKRLPGDLEIHSNGVRYRNILKGEQKVDILFSNIKHLFFQPCDNELIVLIHFHLKHPIMIGKKKTQDVQVYREASDTIVDETVTSRGGRGPMKRRPTYGDEDEIMQEQEERRHRAALNQEFKAFCEKLASADTSLNVDIPIRQLGFPGVPFRQNVLCQPTRDCLVHLSDPPFLVVPLADVEVASLERVLFSLKNFDLIFIMKDKSLPPQHIDSIPMNYLEPIKEWLDSSDVYYMTSNINFNWPNVLKTIREDPQGFYEMGGWNVIQANPDAPPSDASSDSEDGDSVYEDNEEDDDAYESDDSDEDSNESTFDSDEEEDDDYSDASEDEDSDAMDWDELEEKTKKDEIRERQQSRKK